MPIASHCRHILVFFTKGTIRYQIPLYKQFEKEATLLSCKVVHDDLVITLVPRKDLTIADFVKHYVAEDPLA